MNGQTYTKRKDEKMNLKKNPELIPLIEWWEKDGKSTVLCLLVAAVAVGGWYGFKAHRASVKAAAADAVVNTFTTEEIEEASAKFAGNPVEGVLKLRLAKSYFDAGRYDEALATYEALAGKAPDGFEDIPAVGKAQALEALGRYDEALAAFDAFVQAKPKNYLTLTAQLGAVRCLCQKDDKKGALARIEELKTANKDDELLKARIEATETLVKRFEKKAEKPVSNPTITSKPGESK